MHLPIGCRLSQCLKFSSSPLPTPNAQITREIAITFKPAKKGHLSTIGPA